MAHSRAPSLLNASYSLVAGALFAVACTISSRGVESPSPRTDEVHMEGTVARGDALGAPQERMAQIAVVTLHVSGKPIQVELAPGWFLEKHGIHYDDEQRLIVTGEQTQGDDGRVVARKVRQGAVEVDLRDEEGNPLW